MTTPASSYAARPWWQTPLARPTARRHGDGLRSPAKGEHGGECQRIACDNGGSHWYNETNGRYYCAACARTFNEVSRRHGQPPLCELHL
jgi:hypothetical protein